MARSLAAEEVLLGGGLNHDRVEHTYLKSDAQIPFRSQWTRYVKRRDSNTAQWLKKLFPEVKTWTTEYFFIQFKSDHGFFGSYPFKIKKMTYSDTANKKTLYY